MFCGTSARLEKLDLLQRSGFSLFIELLIY